MICLGVLLGIPVHCRRYSAPSIGCLLEADLIDPGFPRWRCVFLTAAVKYDIKINAVLTI